MIDTLFLFPLPSYMGVGVVRCFRLNNMIMNINNIHLMVYYNVKVLFFPFFN
jgi:hypothetical protein